MSVPVSRVICNVCVACFRRVLVLLRLGGRGRCCAPWFLTLKGADSWSAERSERDDRSCRKEHLERLDWAESAPSAPVSLGVLRDPDRNNPRLSGEALC